jgi:small nuclear ribonucleoprotein (snRNP)-like protein
MVSTCSIRSSNTVQAGKGSKMQNLIDYRVRITLNDGRQLTGLLMAFDKFMNLVLADTEEFRRIKRRSTTKAQTDATEQEEKRTLGLVILRGEQVVSLSVDAPPVSENTGRLAPIQSGFGTAKPIGRGISAANITVPPVGLSGPTRGIGGSIPPAFGRGFAPMGSQSGPPPPTGIFNPPHYSLTQTGFAPPAFQQ